MGLIRELQFALRRWRSRPLVALTASLTLALGIGATTSVFSIVDAVMLRPLPYPQADRLVNVWGTFPEWRANPASAETWDRVALSWPEFAELRAGTATLDEIALDGMHQAVFTEGSPEEVKGRIVTASFFSLLGAAPILGRTLARPSAVLRLIAGQGGRLVVAGIVLGVLAAFAAGRAVSTLTFGVRPFEPWILGATVGMLGLVAAAAIAGPARRAAQVDPMVALRE